MLGILITTVPSSVMFGPILVRIIESFNDGITENIEREIRQITKRIDNGPDQIVIKLDLGQNLENKTRTILETVFKLFLVRAEL